MSTDREEAGVLLSDVAGIERRTKEFLTYMRVSDSLMVWGVILFLLYGGLYFVPNFSGWIANGLILLGIVLSFVLGAISRRRRGGEPRFLRVLFTLVGILGFGVLCTWIGRFGPREVNAFWLCYAGFFYFVFGIWAARALAAGGLVLIALTVAGYLWAGPWFTLELAIIGGGGLFFGGLWLRS